jgi:branched-chain amino acid transport system ATP-binding protein
MLEIKNIQVHYNHVVEAVRDVSLTVEDGQIVALLGSNGAGKSTVLKTISQVLFPEEGEILHGQMQYDGLDLVTKNANQIVKAGIVQVPEGRRLFDTLTIEENLLIGAFSRPISELQDSLDEIYGLFPQLADRRKTLSGYLSGGEQQMVAVGRALVAKPKLLMLDEPSLGLAPQIIDKIFEVVTHQNKTNGLSILLVEQNAEVALSVADYGYIMENGRVVLDGYADELKKNDDVKEFFLGFSESGERKNYSEIKHYKRRKRWLS